MTNRMNEIVITISCITVQPLVILNKRRPEKHHTSTDLDMSDIMFQYVRGTACRNNCHCLMRPMHLSTCMRTLAIDMLSTSSGMLFAMKILWHHLANTFPAEPGCAGPAAISHHGITRQTPFLLSQVVLVQPRSAIMASPGKHLSC